MIRVCHVCNSHFADDGRVFHRACLALAAAGYDVHLVAVSEQKEEYQERGVTIHPLPECQGRMERFARRSRVARMAADLKPDLFHVHEPELLGSVIAFAQKRPVIYDVHESYLDVITERDWIAPWLRALIRFAWDVRERQLVRCCAALVVVTERIAQRYYRIHNKVCVVSNFPDLSGIENLPSVARDRRTCVFAGVLRPDRGLSQVLKALAILKERGLSVPLELAGSSSEEYLCSLEREADHLRIRDLVRYHGVLSREEVMKFQQKASIGLVPYLPVANSMNSMANKLLECMALGVPVVFSNFPNYREIAGASGAGIAVDPTQPEQIANAIERLVRNPKLAKQMGEAGKHVVRERFNWNRERIKLLQLYKDILEGSEVIELKSKNRLTAVARP